MDGPLDVLIAGAGPVGLTLAIDLGRRGVRCMVVEREADCGELPKMERCNARTMEIFRRMGIADRIRAAGLPTHVPMDVFIMTRLVDEPILRLEYPSPDVHRRRIREVNDGSEPLEPYQLISQYVLEPLLRSVAQATPGVSVRYGCELTQLRQDADGVWAWLRSSDGEEEMVGVPFLVGCDGGASTVRKASGIALKGRGGIGSLRQVQFRCEDLIERVPLVGRGRHFCFADADPRIIGTTMVVQSDQRHFTFHTGLPEEADYAAVIAEKIGASVSLEIISVNPWTLHLLLAERYADGRVFIAGDAAHLFIPQGGLGMNTGVADALDLSWKLAATLTGWGGPGLLRSYEVERRQVGERNLRASEYAALGTAKWREASSAEVLDDTDEGRAIRAEVARQADIHHRKSHEMRGIELGYRYAESPVVCLDDHDDGYSYTYVPRALPGYRLPHVWCQDGSALHDQLGDGYTLLALGAAPPDTSRLEREIRTVGAPLKVIERSEPAAREVYGHELLLVRPDLHVAWCGDQPPADPAAVAARITGNF